MFDWDSKLAERQFNKWMWSAIWVYKTPNLSRDAISSKEEAINSYYILSASPNSLYLLDFDSVTCTESGPSLRILWKSVEFPFKSFERLYHHVYIPEINSVFFSWQHSNRILSLKVEVYNGQARPMMTILESRLKVIVGICGFYDKLENKVKLFCASNEGKIEMLTIKENPKSEWV